MCIFVLFDMMICCHHPNYFVKLNLKTDNIMSALSHLLKVYFSRQPLKLLFQFLIFLIDIHLIGRVNGNSNLSKTK